MRLADRPVTEVEGLLARIRGIEAVEVRPDSKGRIEAIELEIGPRVAEKRVLRDVESALMSALGLEIDHRAVTIRRVPPSGGERRSPANGRSAPPRGDSEPGKSLSARFMQSSDPSAGRILLESVETQTDGELSCEVTVALTVDGERVERRAREAESRRGRMRAAARATVDAIAAALGKAAAVELEGAEEFSVCEDDGVLVLVKTRRGRTRNEYYGAALIEEDEADAAARAVLDAMNRFLEAREPGRDPTTKGHD